MVGYANKGERPTRQGSGVWACVGEPPVRSGPSFVAPGKLQALSTWATRRDCVCAPHLAARGQRRENLGEWDSHSIDSNGMNIRTEEQTLPFPYSHSYPIPLPFQRDSASEASACVWLLAVSRCSKFRV